MRVTRQLRVTIAVLAAFAAGAVALRFHVTALGVILLVLGAAAATAYFMLVLRGTRLPRNSLLLLRMSGAMREFAPASLIEHLRGRESATLHQLREVLQETGLDPRVGAVMVEIAGLECGLATAQELHDLIRGLRACGKRVTAVLEGDSVSAREYLVASACDEIVVNPDTTLTLVGSSAGGLFLKGALEKLHVQAQALQWKEYKGAAEMFSRETMSDPLRESVQDVVTEWERLMAESVARARGLSVETASELMNSGFVGSRAACERKLVDRIGYSEDVIAPFDEDEKHRRLVGFRRYRRRLRYLRDRGRRSRIALVYGLGPIIAGDEPLSGEFLSAAQTAGELDQAARDPRVRAIVFRVNSPGGSAVGSDIVWRAVSDARKRGKPVIVSMGDVAGSGGYYVAAGADAIVAQPATVTGSIGVVYVKFSAAELIARLGVSVDHVKSNAMSDVLSPTRAMTAAELEQLNQVMGELYATFTAKVAEGRRLDPASAEAVARGRIWSGTAAAANRLIDALGGLDRAVEIARDKAQLKAHEEHELVSYSGPSGILAAGLSLLPGAVGTNWMREIARALEVPETWLPALLDLAGSARSLFLTTWL